MAEKKLKAKSEKLKTVKANKQPTVKELEVKAEPKTVKKKGNLVVDVYDLTGKVVETVDLPAEIFGVKVNKRLIAQAIRVYLANQRAGSASTKTRGEVRGSTRKIYRQKGTGRARHGGVRAPIFVHGGVAHGPKPQDYSLKLPQKMKKAALNSILSAKMASGEIKVVTDFDKADGKTKQMAVLFKKINPSGKKTLFVIDKKYENLVLAVRNIMNVTYEYVNHLHVYEIMQNHEIVLMKSAVDELKKGLSNTKISKDN